VPNELLGESRNAMEEGRRKTRSGRCPARARLLQPLHPFARGEGAQGGKQTDRSESGLALLTAPVLAGPAPPRGPYIGGTVSDQSHTLSATRCGWSPTNWSTFLPPL